MNDMTIHGGSAVTMTSLELVEFINSQRGEGESELRHDHFMAKVPKVLGDAAPNFRGSYTGRDGTARPCYTFPKREACLMAMSYSYELQAKVFDRMTALEARPIDPMQVLADPAAMRGLLLTYTEKVLTLENKVGELAPKADALDRLATANGSFCIRDAAKTLQVQEKWLKKFMREHEWIYQRPMGHGWLAYADKLKQGVMEHKTTTGEKSDGSEWVDTQARITAKGMTKLSALIQEAGQPRLVA